MKKGLRFKVSKKMKLLAHIAKGREGGIELGLRKAQGYEVYAQTLPDAISSSLSLCMWL